MNSRSKFLTIATALVAVLALMWSGHRLIGETSGPTDESVATQPTRDAVERLLEYDDSIQLTPEQEAVRVAALEQLPAPCCSQFTAATCCCKCNMARATWGLAKHLIVDEGMNADQVRDEVADWHAAINPEGFSGAACFNGGCSRAFAKDGCGGMERNDLVF